MAEKHPEEVAPEQQLKYQTWVLRVSIHCEGCRKKVKKVLKAIHGVYEMEIDPRQHKVTVTGNVEADTLLKKLTRSGKQAELWPLPEQNNDKKTANNINKERPQASDDHNKEDEDDVEDEDDHDQKNPGQAETGEKATVGGGSGAGGGNGGKKKKKKKKKKVGQNPNGDPNSASEGGGNGGPANNGDLAPLVIGIDPGAVNQGLPIHHLYSHPPVYNYLPPPVYGSNYSTAYHSTSDSYYARQYPGQQARHVVLSYPERYGPPVNPINTAEDVYYDNEMESACSIM